jgi:hypothetical protein
MILKAISEPASSLEATAFCTDPPLTAEVFNRFQDKVGFARQLAGTKFETMGDMLVVTSQNFSPTLISAINEVLTIAEDTLAQEKQSEKQKIQSQHDFKKAKIQAISKATGLPVK